MSASALAISLEASTFSASILTAFAGVPPALTCSRMKEAGVLSPRARASGRVAVVPVSSELTRTTISSSLFQEPSLYLRRGDSDNRRNPAHSRRSTSLYCIRRDYFAPHSKPQTKMNSYASWPPSLGGSESPFASVGAAGSVTHYTGSGCGSGRRGGGRSRGGIRRRASCLAGGRTAGDSSSSSGEGDEEGRGKRRRTREEAFYGSSIPASKRQRPEEEDMWSRHSVFEFKSLNDPDTNASCYKGLSGQPSGVSAHRAAARGQPAELRLTTQQRPTIFEEALEAERAPVSDGNADDFFQFREKEELASGRSGVEKEEVEVEVRRLGGGGGSPVVDSSSVVTVELATQLGLPATATYDELRSAYRVEIKRCHPDVAGDNEFRVKLLERRFQRLRSSWDNFVEEHTAASSSGRSANPSVSTQTVTGNPQAARARARARARAQAEAQAQYEAEVAAAAAARRKRRNVMDPGRKILDAGGPSC